jgi:hypothetical protein
MLFDVENPMESGSDLAAANLGSSSEEKRGSLEGAY